MPRSPIFNDAMRRLDEANHHSTLAIMYRDFARLGEIERALSVRRELDALSPARDYAALAERFPRLPQILDLLAKAAQ